MKHLIARIQLYVVRSNTNSPAKSNPVVANGVDMLKRSIGIQSKGFDAALSCNFSKLTHVDIVLLIKWRPLTMKYQCGN